MLDHVRQVHRRPVDARVLQRSVQEPARRPHEGSPLDVLVVARLLAHHHHPRILRAFAEHGLGPQAPQLARAARGCGRPYGGQVRDVGHAATSPAAGGSASARFGRGSRGHVPCVPVHYRAHAAGPVASGVARLFGGTMVRTP